MTIREFEKELNKQFNNLTSNNETSISKIGKKYFKMVRVGKRWHKVEVKNYNK